MIPLSYSSALEFLFPRTTQIKFGLDSTRALLAACGDPQRQFGVVHVAGTNGKGSVSALIAAALEEHGLKVGLYTSPHLVSFRERIRVQGVPISEMAVASWVNHLRPTIDAIGATFFEATTAIAFADFAARGVDIAVVEVGLGGRLDSTNVVEPLVTVVTRIALDHQKYLGDTIEQIAAEKAGIAKPGIPFVIGEQDPDVVHFLVAAATSAQAARSEGSRKPSARNSLASLAQTAGPPLAGPPYLAAAEPRAPHRTDAQHKPVGGEVRGAGQRSDSGATVGRLPDRAACIVVVVPASELYTGPLARLGAHQRRNAAVARAALAQLPAPLAPSDAEVARAFARTTVAGRLDRRGKWLFDVAHNPDGMRALVAAIDELEVPRPIHAVVSILGDKAWPEMLVELDRAIDVGILTEAPTAAGRKWEPAWLERWLADPTRPPAKAQWRYVASFDAALTIAESGAGTVLVTGSFHTVGDVLVARGFELP